MAPRPRSTRAGDEVTDPAEISPDLLWYGQRLSRAINRANDAEAEAAELRETVDHLMRMGAQAAEQVSTLSRLLDEAREAVRDAEAELNYRLGPAWAPRCRVGSPDGSDGRT